MSSEEDVEYSEIQSALGSIGLSAALIFGATLLSQGLGFLTRVTMARYLPVDGYGNVVIGLSVLNLFGIVALAGMPDAVSRYIPRQETANERRNILTSALQIVGALSIFLAIGIYLAAELLATSVFGNDGLVWIIRIFAGILPFYAVFKVSLGGFRGYEKTYPQVVLQKVLRPALQLAGIILFVMLGYGTTGIAFAYALAFILVSIVGVLLLYHVGEISLKDITRQAHTDQSRELLTFSVPLAASGAITVIAKHSDLILLGVFKSSTAVGIYEVAFRMAMFVPLIFTLPVGYLFQPIMSKFDDNSDHLKMEQLYTVIIRWVIIATFPVFILFFLFPEQSLVFFFGEEYSGGKLALQILLTGFIISLLPGLTNSFLISVGETKVLMYISAGTMVLNVLLNVILIPIYGIIGAAIATTTAQIINNAFQSLIIYRYYGFHPYKYKYVIPTFLMGIITILAYSLPIIPRDLTFIEGCVIAAALGLLNFLLLVVTKSIYAVELELLDQLLEQAGIPLTVSVYLQRFVR